MTASEDFPVGRPVQGAGRPTGSGGAVAADDGCTPNPVVGATTLDLTYEQAELEDAMSDVSETSYCAGWMHGTEEAVWRLIHEGGDWGMCRWKFNDRELERVRRAMVAADCWIVWDNGPKPVPLDEWRAQHPIGGVPPVVVGATDPEVVEQQRRLAAMTAARHAILALRQLHNVPDGVTGHGTDITVGCVTDDLGRMAEVIRAYFLGERDRLAAENAELRAETVELAYRLSNAANERDTARAELAEVRAKLAEIQVPADPDVLAAVIRRVDGAHDLGAGALAEALIGYGVGFVGVAALASAPTERPGCPCGVTEEHGPHEFDLPAPAGGESS